jgi:hypothetical protein
VTVSELRSHWRVEIPQCRPKDSAQVHQTLFLLGGGVWGRDYVCVYVCVCVCVHVCVYVCHQASWFIR